MPTTKSTELIEFIEIDGHLDEESCSLTLIGKSLLTNRFKVIVKKVLEKPAESYRIDEGYYYIEGNNQTFYIVDVEIGQRPSTLYEIVENKDYNFEYWKYGLPTHVYTAICGSVLTLL